MIFILKYLTHTFRDLTMNNNDVIQNHNKNDDEKKSM